MSKFSISNYEVIMPRDFKSFIKENEKTLNENKGKASEYQDLIDKYKNMGNDELMSNLLSEASKLKQQGKLDSNQLNNLSSTLTPFLNNEQKDMLANLIKAIDAQ